jgi:predicted Fe-Mo cluster-binding NifX family protein
LKENLKKFNEEMIKIAIPTDDKEGLNDKVAEHFGRCDTYTFLDEEGQILEIIDNDSEHHGGSGLPPEIMKKNRVNILLCRNIGIKALNLCRQLGISVYVYQAETVKGLFNIWRKNEISQAGAKDSCQEHKL